MELDILNQLKALIGYKPTSTDYFRQALTHASYTFENQKSCKDYQRLEFLGDAILGMLLAEELYGRFPNASEGELSRFRAALASEPALAKIARSLNLGKLIRLGHGEQITNGSDKDSILADVFEALLAAVYLDAGMEEAQRFILRLFQTHLDAPLSTKAIPDAKSELQELLTAKKLPELTYRLVSESGPSHDPNFCFDVLSGEMVLGSGCGKSKKNAQQAAAVAALKQLKSV